VQRQSRLIVVMRHAKAEQLGPSDFERELTARGRDDARAAGAWLAAQGIVADHALVSAAPRARQTWEAVAEEAGWALEPQLDRGLYAAGPDTALDLVRETPAGAETLVLLGHNPTIAYLAQLLDDGEGDEVATREMATGYPTCALAVFSHDGDWTSLDAGSARLQAFHASG
jgi:phosphohistidine phosphatase